MRKPDETRVETVHGVNVTIEVWTDPTEDPWDGDEPLEPGAEGWDLFVRATIGFSGGTVEGFGQLASNWIYPDSEGRKYLEDQTEELERNAIDAAFTELARVASGVKIQEALKEQQGALQILSNVNLHKLERAKALYLKEATRPAREEYEVANQRIAGLQQGFRKLPKGERSTLAKLRLELQRQEQAFGEIFAGVIAGKLEP